MKTILHLQTRPTDALAEQLATAQAALPGTTVETLRLTADSTDADYRALVEKVFQADSVQVW
jgi:hypothetical protein